MKAEKIKSPLVERALKLATLPAEGLEQLPETHTAGLGEGHVKAVRGQRTEWHDLKIDDSTTGILICSTVLDADIWLALRDEFDPDPELPNLAVFCAHEIPILKDKTAAQLREIHKVKLTFGAGSKVRQ